MAGGARKGAVGISNCVQNEEPRLGKYVAHRHTTHEFLQRPVPAVPSVTKATAGGGGMLDGKTHKVIGLHTHFSSMISYHM